MDAHQVTGDPRLEAQYLVGDDFEARVLEPSPPAVLDGPWFADDPVAVNGARPGRRIVSPVGNGDLTWDEWLQAEPHHAGWVADRWLGAYRRLGRPGGPYTETRVSLHRVGVYVVSPARRRANGKLALRWTRGGFGTPFFSGAGGAEQVRVAALNLVRCVGDAVSVNPLGSLNQAAAIALDGPPDVAWAEGFDVPAPGDLHEPLPIDAPSAQLVGDWFGFAWSVLESLRAGPGSVDPTRVQLWPEHFDAAFDCRSPRRQRQATFGASPGDAAVPEPYLYVLPFAFDELAPNDLWNAQGFRGALLALRDFVDEPDQRAAALAFFAQRQALLDAD